MRLAEYSLTRTWPTSVKSTAPKAAVGVGSLGGRRVEKRLQEWALWGSNTFTNSVSVSREVAGHTWSTSELRFRVQPVRVDIPRFPSLNWGRFDRFLKGSIVFLIS
jgi:hypothetical protein